MDDAIEGALAALGETSVPRGSSKYRFRYEQRHRKQEHEVEGWLLELHKSWREAVPDGESLVLFFEYIRIRYYELYDRTLAYSTLRALVRAAIASLGDAGNDRRIGADDRNLFIITQELLRLLFDDAHIFQPINRGSTEGVIRAVAMPLAGRRQTNLHGALPRTEGVLALLDHFSNRPSTDWRTVLSEELRAEAEALRLVYDGIGHAAAALDGHETALRKLVREESIRTHRAPNGGRIPLSLETEVYERLVESRQHIATNIDLLDKNCDDCHLSPQVKSRVSELSSRLRPWKVILDQMAATGQAGPDVLSLPNVTIRYCFPFAVKADEEDLRKLHPALERRMPGRDRHEPRYANEDEGTLLSELSRCLASVTIISGISIRNLNLTEFWQGVGHEMFGGVKVEFPSLTDSEEPDDPWVVWAELSRLGNHCLCVERKLSNPTPHELYAALRSGAHYSGGWSYRFGWAVADSTQAPMWRTVDDLSHDLILAIARTLGADPNNEPDYLHGPFHQLVVVTARGSLGNGPQEIAGTLGDQYGGKLLRTNHYRLAATLEEWVRYAVIESDASLAVTAAEFGYFDDWLFSLAEITVVGVSGNPSWQTQAYVEACQFAASWRPLLLMWNREVMAALEPSSQESAAELRELEQEVRRSILTIYSEELCRLHVHRRYLDGMLKAVGTSSIIHDLERQLESAGSLIAKHEREDQEMTDRTRNLFLAVLAVFGVLNVSTVFAVLDLGNNRGLITSHAWIVWEGVVQLAFFLGAIGVLGIAYWRSPGRKPGRRR
ncbi:MAG: hypothetical protein M3083_12770 [Actinomycetota bacterium]|nr:hypothetical protein [Actinomycetota bacterium]MDQ6944991.1 hypothetical protein [Actinomycetota bacterium]